MNTSEEIKKPEAMQETNEILCICGHLASDHADTVGCMESIDSRHSCQCRLNYRGVMAEARVIALSAENEQLREVNSQTWCAYCEKKYPRTPDSMEQIREHIATCEKHPMRELEAEIMELSSALAIYADSNNWTLHMAAASSLVDPRSAEWDGPGYGPQIAKETLDSFVRGEILCPDCAGSGEVAGDYFADDGMATCDKCKGKGKVTP